MIDCNYLVEILTPKKTDGIIDKASANQFAERYYRVIEHGMGLSVPDNPMGQLLKTAANLGIEYLLVVR